MAPQLCKRRFRERSKEKGLFKKGLEEAQWADVSPLLKNFMLKVQWRLAVDAQSKIFAPLPYQRHKLICTSVRVASERGQRRRGFLKKASKRPNRRTLVRFLKTSCSRRSGASLQTRSTSKQRVVIIQITGKARVLLAIFKVGNTLLCSYCCVWLL